jgi:hypothetical protein
MNRWALRVGAIFLAAVSLSYAGIPNRSDPTTFLGPTAAFKIAAPLNEDTAAAFLGEAGLKNFRLNGTVGWDLTYYQRFKISAEFLRQKITYAFFDGNDNVWLNQGAVGVGYQYDPHESSRYHVLFDISAYYSHAPSANLGNVSGTYLNSSNVLVPYAFNKRIAGSNAGGISPAIIFMPIRGTQATLALNYDNVHYDTVNTHSKNAIGLGGTVGLNQVITDDVSLNLSAGVRQPYNNYQADIVWGNSYYGTWLFDLFGAYTAGKNSLPSTYNVGVGVTYLMDGYQGATPGAVTSIEPKRTVRTGKVYKDMVYKDAVGIPLAMPTEWDESSLINKELVKWTSVPAVYVPSIIAVPDVCQAPILINDIPQQGNHDQPSPVHINVANFFAGGNLTYTVQIISGSANVTVNGSILTFNASSNSRLTVTATNACGSVTSNAFTYSFD